MAGITTEERIRRRMLYFHVSRDIVVEMLTAESGGDVVATVNGKRRGTDYWREDRADQRRATKTYEAPAKLAGRMRPPSALILQGMVRPEGLEPPTF